MEGKKSPVGYRSLKPMLLKVITSGCDNESRNRATQVLPADPAG